MTVYQNDPDHPIVWVVQQPMRRDGGRLVPAYDLSDAERYGQLRVVLSDRVKPWAPEQALPAIHKAALLFRHDHDFLLLIGNVVHCSMVLAAAISKVVSETPIVDDPNPMVRCLYWQRSTADYGVIEIPAVQFICSNFWASLPPDWQGEPGRP